MNKTQLAVRTGLAALLATSLGSAQAEIFNATALAEVVTPVTVTENTQLNFGQVAAGAAATGTVVVAAGGGVSTTGAASAISGTGATPATFTLNGLAGASITVTLDATSAQLDVAGGGTPMNLHTLTNTGLPVSLPGGTATFDVGATLDVGAGQPTGNYSTAAGAGAPYTVTVNYN